MGIVALLLIQGRGDAREFGKRPGVFCTSAGGELVTGTTGWSGGTGGSQLGTNIQGAVESSPTWQPPTARGLDLAGTAEDQPAC